MEDDDLGMLSGATELELESEEMLEDYELTRQRMVAAQADQVAGPRDLMAACRVGDLARVKFLVEHEEVNVNQKDAFDALPIYFCCLCGHQDVLEYLLEHGARLDDGTFEAHRCYYAALTKEIQQVLREAKAKPNLGAMDHYAEQMRKWLCPTSFSREGDVASATGEQPSAADGHCHSDFVLERPGLPDAPVHRCVLAARCSYFDRMFRNAWRRRSRKLLPRCTGKRGHAFGVVLEYLYTDSANFDLALADDVQQLAEQCGLERLADEVRREVKLVMMHLRQIQGRSNQISRIMVKPGGETTGSLLRESFAKLLPPLVEEGSLSSVADDIVDPSSAGSGGDSVQMARNYADVVFAVQGQTGASQQFHCHRAVLAARSEYFRALFAGDWSAHCQSNVLSGPQSVVPVTLQPWVFHALLEHIYTDWTPTVLPSVTTCIELCAAVTPHVILGVNKVHEYSGLSVADIDDKMRAVGDACIGDAAAELEEVVEITAMVLDAACMFLDIGLRQLCIATLVRCIQPCTATRCIEIGMLFSSARLLDASTGSDDTLLPSRADSPHAAATNTCCSSVFLIHWLPRLTCLRFGCVFSDFVVDSLLEVALPTRTAVIAADCIRRAQRQAIECGMEIDSMQQLPADFSAVSGASGVIKDDFAEWLDSPRNHEVALHLVRELIERYTTLHFEDVLGAAAGPRRAESGITHAADLLGEDGVKQTFGSQVRAVFRIVPEPWLCSSISQLTFASLIPLTHRTQLRLPWPPGGHTVEVRRQPKQHPLAALCKTSWTNCWQGGGALKPWMSVQPFREFSMERNGG